MKSGLSQGQQPTADMKKCSLSEWSCVLEARLLSLILVTDTHDQTYIQLSSLSSMLNAQ